MNTFVQTHPAKVATTKLQSAYILSAIIAILATVASAGGYSLPTCTATTSSLRPYGVATTW